MSSSFEDRGATEVLKCWPTAERVTKCDNSLYSTPDDGRFFGHNCQYIHDNIISCGYLLESAKRFLSVSTPYDLFSIMRNSVYRAVQPQKMVKRLDISDSGRSRIVLSM